jgi:hypothetical protein
MPFPVFGTLDEVPEAFRAEYENRDGAWHAKVPDVATLELTLVKVRGEKADVTSKLREAESRVAALQAEIEARKGGATEAQLADIQARAQAAMTPLQEELAQFKSKYRKSVLSDRVQAFALQYGVMPDRIKVAMKILDDRVDLGDEDGIVWKDAEGRVTAMSPEQFFADFKKSHEYLFAFTGKGGSGSSASDRNGSTTTTTASSDAVDARKRSQVLGAF